MLNFIKQYGCARTMGSWVLAGASVMVLSACGGGGSSRSVVPASVAAVAPEAPLLSLAPGAIKNFHFSWPDVAKETGYRLLENPDGVSGYAQVASIPADAESHDLGVFLPGRVNASYILQACNSVGCSDSSAVFVDGSLVQAVGYLKASNSDISDVFGYSVSVSGDGGTLAVGAYNEDSNATGINGSQSDNSTSNSGAVYVFVKDGANWSQQGYVKAAMPDVSDLFGWSVALSGDGNTLAVGAYREDGSIAAINGNEADNGAIDSGAGYIFVRSGTDWSQQAYIKASNADAGDRFGYILSLSADGNRLAVGAYAEDSDATGVGGAEDNNNSSNSGAAYVFQRSGTDWSQQAYIKASAGDSTDFFGINVALSGDGDTLAVGTHREDSDASGIDGAQDNNNTSNSGAAYIFAETAGIWSQQAYIKSSNPEFGDSFGQRLALSGDGNTLAVGATQEDSNATGIDGGQDDNSIDNSGAVYVFGRTGITWSQEAYLKPSNTQLEGGFGSNVALSGDGNTLAVAASLERDGATGINPVTGETVVFESGAVYLFSRSAGLWTETAYIKSTNTGREDRFGTSISLAADAGTLAVGAYLEDSSSVGIGGVQENDDALNAGAVYLY